MALRDRPRILLVDDEEQVTRGLAAILRKEFDVTTASSGAEGLAALAEHGPFEVVVSDMRMPGMNGAELLTRVREAAPGVTRMLLTGQADVESAMAAINEGGVFRYLTKPCAPTALRTTLHEAVEQHRLEGAERELLEKTLRGSVQVLTEMLALVHPIAARQAGRTREVVVAASAALRLPDPWRFEVAAMLSHLGCLTLPAGVLDRASRGEPLGRDEARAWEGHPEVGAELVRGIPRLEAVAEMVARQQTAADPALLEGEPAGWDPVLLGGELLRAAGAFLRELTSAGDERAACAALRRADDPPRALVDALETVRLTSLADVAISIPIQDLLAGMVLQEDLCSKDGVVLAGAGAVVNATLLKLIQNFVGRKNTADSVLVLTPGDASDSGDAGPANLPGPGQAA